MAIYIQPAGLEHAAPLLHLYRETTLNSNGLIRKPEEITEPFITEILTRSSQNGLALLAMDQNQVVGEIHAYTPNLFAFQHLLTDLTIVIHPTYQGKGVGRRLFSHFLKVVQEDFPHILRVELYVKESQGRSVGFYESLGFRNGGRQDRKIFISERIQETPLHMVWMNPNFQPH